LWKPDKNRLSKFFSKIAEFNIAENMLKKLMLTAKLALIIKMSMNPIDSMPQSVGLQLMPTHNSALLIQAL